MKSLVTIRPIRESSAGHFAQVIEAFKVFGFNVRIEFFKYHFQIVMVDLDAGQSSALANNNAISLTHGKFEATEILDWDVDNRTM